MAVAGADGGVAAGAAGGGAAADGEKGRGSFAARLAARRAEGRAGPARDPAEALLAEVRAFVDGGAISEDELGWWRDNSSRYPRLAGLARRILGLQPGSTIVERVFSLARLIHVPRRNRLSPGTSEALVRLKVAAVCR